MGRDTFMVVPASQPREAAEFEGVDASQVEEAGAHSIQATPDDRVQDDEHTGDHLPGDGALPHAKGGHGRQRQHCFQPDWFVGFAAHGVIAFYSYTISISSHLVIVVARCSCSCGWPVWLQRLYPLFTNACVF
jgi:hypothetical protein